jgi:predicted MFS family arabinose efflux permease
MTFPTILPDFAILKGHEMKRITLLLIIFGVVSIPARWVGGYVADRPRVNALLFLSLTIIALSMTSLALPFTGDHFSAMAVVCGFRGAISGTLEVLQPTVLILLFGQKRVTTTIGYDMVAINAGQLTATPLTGRSTSVRVILFEP